jgi:5-methylcytosine-specific restriction endonuclease McrA
VSRHHGKYEGGRRIAERNARLFAAKGTTCHLCGGPGADSADHLVPVSLGGPQNPGLDGLAPAHHICNKARGAMTLAEWFATHPLPTRDNLPPSRDW